jgi:hypothetical protein
MSLGGELQTFPVRDLLEWLARRRATGRLTFTRGMTIRRFDLRDGRVTLASSSEEWTRLGRLLLDRNLIDDLDLESALERCGPSLRLGAVLIDDGLITPAQLGSVLAEKARALLLDTLAWSDGSFHFDDQAAPHRLEAGTPPVDLFEVVAKRPRLKRRPPDPANPVPVADDDVIEMRPLPAPPQRAAGS